MLLRVDAALNLALGIVLAALPAPVIAFLGLPTPDPPFYARVLGGVLLGVGGALALESRRGSPFTGLGLAGAVAVNLAAGTVLAGLLVAGGLRLPLRGSLLLWTLVVALVLLSLLEVKALSRASDGT